MYRKDSLRLDIFDEVYQLISVKMSGSMELVKKHPEMVQPVVHYLIFDVLFTIRLAHAVNEMATWTRLNVD